MVKSRGGAGRSGRAGGGSPLAGMSRDAQVSAISWARTFANSGRDSFRVSDPSDPIQNVARELNASGFLSVRGEEGRGFTIRRIPTTQTLINNIVAALNGLPLR